MANSVVRGNRVDAAASGGGEALAEAAGVGLLVSVSADAATRSAFSGNAASAHSSAAGPAASLGGGVLGAASGTANAISDSVISRNASVASNDGTGAAGAGGAGVGAVTSPLTSSQVAGNTVTASASGTDPSGGAVEVNALGGGIAAALNQDANSTASAVSDTAFARNSVTAAYSGTDAGLAQAVGGAIGASAGVADSTVSGNRATATGSGAGVTVSGAPTAARRLPGLGAATRSGRPTARPDLVGPDLVGPNPARQKLARPGLPRLAAVVKAQVRAQLQRLGGAHLTAPAARSAAAPSAGSVLTSALANGAGIGGLTGPVDNSTISANSASATAVGTGVATTAGGGIDVAGALANATIAGNAATASGPAGSSATGGGVETSTSMANTVVAGDTPTDCGAATGADKGGNLDSDGTCGLSPANGSISAGQADLGPLRDNGGPTRTRALEPGSQAIGLGVPAVCEQLAGPTGVLDTDQRGGARNSAQRGVCDSGAYDTGGVAP